MKTYLYNELGNDTPIRITEEEILALYWESWSNRMRSKGLDNLICYRMCILDWVEINWAWEEK